MFGRGDRGTRRLQSRLPLEVDHHRRKARLLRLTGTLIPRTTIVLAVIVLSAVGSLLMGAVGTQGTPGPDPKENAPSPQEECPDAKIVHERLATGNLQTDLFEVGTARFIVSYEILKLQPGSMLPGFQATVEDEDGRDVSSGTIPSPQPGDPVRTDLTPYMGRTIVDAEPGSYRVAINPDKSDRRYAVLVEECGVPEVS